MNVSQIKPQELHGIKLVGISFVSYVILPDIPAFVEYNINSQGILHMQNYKRIMEKAT